MSGSGSKAGFFLKKFGGQTEYFGRIGKSAGMSGFTNFIMRGNLVPLAVAVVIGAQFSGLVKQFARRSSIRCWHLNAR
jgi:Large-conductance mechanosensitive channel, MscL